MSGEPAEPTESVTYRSALPGVPGFPWWGAVLLAVTATAIGFAYDAGAGNKELGAVFATCYILGSLAAVLVVRRGGIFTAVIQPPLILFVAVPTSYFLFHGGQLSGVKDILINCGYPLIERFPLMFFTAAAVLLVGMGRWYLETSHPHAGQTAPHTTTPAALIQRVTRLFARPASAAADADAAPAPRSRRAASTRTAATRRGGRAEAPSRARHNRPPESDIAASAAAADRRERAAARERPARPRRQGEPPFDPEGQPRPQRRPRNPAARDPRDPRNLREPRAPRDPREPRRNPPPVRGGTDGPDPYGRPRRRPSYEYPAYEPRPDDRFEDRYPERPRRAAAGDSTHHPISQVRYRGSDEDRHTEHRSRPRTSHRRDADYGESDS